jgi:hypothetical protein
MTAELYDIENDPKQYNNLYNDHEYADVAVDLKQKLNNRLAEIPPVAN